MSNREDNHKTLGKKDIILFTVSAILLLDTLAATASIGPQSLFWWVFLGIVFFLPFGLITTELACAYPEQGGIYAWVKKAYGPKWGARITWSYWVNVTIWIPAIFILLVGIAQQLFGLDLSLSMQVFIGIVLTWVLVFTNLVSMNLGKWVPNVGAVFKIIIFLFIIFASINYMQNHGMANTITLETIKPNWEASLQYIPAIIYGMLGFELISADASDISEPHKNIPKAIFISGLIIIGLYFFGTLAILATVPAAEINLVEGLVDTLRLLLQDFPGADVLVLLLGVMALYTFFSNGATWAMGSNRAAAEAAKMGELPAAFAIEGKNKKTPTGAAILMGIVSTVILILYGFLFNSNEDLFWSLFAFSGVIFLLPYIGMVLSFVKMRMIDKDHDRPFRVLGGISVAILLAVVCTLILLISIFLFIYTPGEGISWPVLLGSVVTVIVGELMILGARKE